MSGRILLCSCLVCGVMYVVIVDFFVEARSMSVCSGFAIHIFEPQLEMFGCRQRRTPIKSQTLTPWIC